MHSAVESITAITNQAQKTPASERINKTGASWVKFDKRKTLEMEDDDEEEEEEEEEEKEEEGEEGGVVQ